MRIEDQSSSRGGVDGPVTQTSHRSCLGDRNDGFRPRVLAASWSQSSHPLQSQYTWFEPLRAAGFQRPKWSVCIRWFCVRGAMTA
ncbi:hypothetical protein Mapa_001145 [Marchantia paleacea]|nr:hypothetical protein Mapa_001145 [Marchantia paleacea]